MEQKAFDLIVGKAQPALEGLGFRRLKSGGPGNREREAVFAGDAVAYGILYEEGKKRLSLRTCGLADGEPDGNWKPLSVWLYDPATDSAAQAQSIVNDFVATVTGPRQKAAAVSRKKRKKDDENNVDPTFFFNRFVGVFPELKEELAAERSAYGDVRSVTFARERLLPKLDGVLSSPEGKDRAAKCAALLNDLYVAGDMDVRSIITIVLLNGFSGASVKTLRPQLSEELAKSFKAALKLKGKKIKPEKKKKPKKFMADTLADR